MGTARDKSFWTDATTGVLNDSGKRAFERDSFPDLVETVFSEKPILAGFSSAISTASDATSVSLTDEVLLDQSGTVATGTLQQVRGAFLQTEETGDFTLALTAGGAMTPVNHATQADVTIPLNSSVAFPIGTRIQLLQTGLGFARLLAASGVTLHTPYLKNSCSNGKGAVIEFIKIDTDEWYLIDNGGLDFPILQGFSETVAFAYGLVQLVPGYIGPLVKARETGTDVDKIFYASSDHILDVGSAAEHQAANALRVERWYSQDGVANTDVIQLTDADQPTLVLDGVNGLPCLEGDGANTVLIATSAPYSAPTTKTTWSMLARTDADSAAVQRMIALTASGGSNGNEIRFTDNDGFLFGSVQVAGSSSTVTGAVGLHGDGFHAFTYINGSTVNVSTDVSIQTDRAAAITDSDASAGGASLNQFGIMGGGANNAWLDGRMANAIGLLGVVGTPEQQLLTSWQMAMAGI